MAVMRGPDGKIIESDSASADSDEKTRRIPRRSQRTEEPTGPTADARGRGGEEEPTDRVDRGGGRSSASSASSAGAAGAAAGDGGDSDAPKTKLLRRSKPKKTDDESDGGGSSGGQDNMDDPVVGWVVVISGPGRGASLPLGYGMNSIGRSSNERICLDFGDEQISRSQHAVITYDPRGRKYFVQHGGGKNLTYIEGDQPVLTPVELKGGETISLGATELRFVPFCGKDFDWQDQNDQ